MKLYHKIFKSHADMSVYLENMNSLISYDEELLNRLTKARNPDELHDAKCSVLRDFHDIYAFDASENTGCQTPRGCGRFLGPELSNSKTASILHRTQTP